MSDHGLDFRLIHSLIFRISMYASYVELRLFAQQVCVGGNLRILYYIKKYDSPLYSLYSLCSHSALRLLFTFPLFALYSPCSHYRAI